jgi:hypothetical protein
MADDLAADLHEAEAEGAHPEEVLGDGASDPRAFAAAWARERGLVQPHWSDRVRRPGVLLLGAAAVLASVGIATAMVVSSRSGGQPAVAPTAVSGTVSGTSMFVGNTARIVGTSIERTRLMPSGIVLSPNVPDPPVLGRAPTSITTWVRNAGTTAIRRVTLIVEADGRRSVRTITGLAVHHSRAISVPLPRGLPPRFTLRVSTRLQPHETNPANNRATWRVRVRS